MFLQMDSLDNPLTTRQTQAGREISIELYQNRRFRFIEDPDCQLGVGLVMNRTRTRSDGPEPLLLLVVRPFAQANNGILAGDDAPLNTTNTEHDSEMKTEAEEMQLHRMAKVHDFLEMWQGSQN